MSRFISNSDKRFDFRAQLATAKDRESTFGRLFTNGTANVEVKSEEDWWWKTGNLAIEYKSRGKPSGLAVTTADLWVHELYAPDERLVCRLLWQTDRLKEICKAAARRGQVIHAIGEDGAQDCVLLPLADILGLRRVKL